MSDTPKSAAQPLTRKMIEIATKDSKYKYTAVNGSEAIVMFFRDIKSGVIDLSDLGVIAVWRDGESEYPFRLGPALVKCGLLRRDALHLIHEALDLDISEQEITEMISRDAWMVEAEVVM